MPSSVRDNARRGPGQAQRPAMNTVRRTATENDGVWTSTLHLPVGDPRIMSGMDGWVVPVSAVGESNGNEDMTEEQRQGFTYFLDWFLNRGPTGLEDGLSSNTPGRNRSGSPVPQRRRLNSNNAATNHTMSNEQEVDMDMVVEERDSWRNPVQLHNQEFLSTTAGQRREPRTTTPVTSHIVSPVPVVAPQDASISRSLRSNVSLRREHSADVASPPTRFRTSWSAARSRSRLAASNNTMLPLNESQSFLAVPSPRSASTSLIRRSVLPNPSTGTTAMATSTSSDVHRSAGNSLRGDIDQARVDALARLEHLRNMQRYLLETLQRRRRHMQTEDTDVNRVELTETDLLPASIDAVQSRIDSEIQPLLANARSTSTFTDSIEQDASMEQMMASSATTRRTSLQNRIRHSELIPLERDRWREERRRRLRRYILAINGAGGRHSGNDRREGSVRMGSRAWNFVLESSDEGEDSDVELWADEAQSAEIRVRFERLRQNRREDEDKKVQNEEEQDEKEPWPRNQEYGWRGLSAAPGPLL